MSISLTNHPSTCLSIYLLVAINQPNICLALAASPNLAQPTAGLQASGCSPPGEHGGASANATSANAPGGSQRGVNPAAFVGRFGGTRVRFHRGNPRNLHHFWEHLWHPLAGPPPPRPAPGPKDRFHYLSDHQVIA